MVKILALSACLVIACATPAPIVSDTGGPQIPGPPPPPPPPETPSPPLPPGGVSRAYGLWTPGEHDTCTKAQHDAYSVIGPDGKLYPTWHPPVDPSGCTFGHEHGKDPHGSALYATVGDIPFGYANEQLLDFDGQLPRHEDHVGHKIEWVNGLQFIPGSQGGEAKTCDTMLKLHQGTHSPDAFTNNVHELAYHLSCTDGTVMHITMMASLGNGGSFLQTCTGETVRIEAGMPTPPDSPGGSDTRQIPTRACIDKFITGVQQYGASYSKALSEVWPVSLVVTRADGSRIAQFATYNNIKNVSRYYDQGVTGHSAHSLDICWETDDSTDGRTQGDCKAVRAMGLRDWTSPSSPFTGTDRSVRWNQIGLMNAGQPTTYYTDPFGRNGQATPFKGSIKQVFSAITNDGGKVYAPGNFGADYTAPGVHAPN